MNKKLKVTISIIASMIIIIGSAFTIYAATTEYSLKSHGIIAHDGDGDGAYTNTAKDIYIDSGDLKTINDAVVAGKTSLASAINSATASSATNKTTLGTTDANLPAFNDLKNAIANVKAAGNEEGIITGQNNVINNVGGKTSASLGADGSLTLSYDGTTGTSSVGNPTWAAIENKLSGKTDSAGNPIYSGITDLDSLENAITADNDNYYKEGASDKVVSLSQNSIFTKLSANQIFLSCTVNDSIGNDYGTCYKKTDAPCLFMKGGSSYQLVVAPSTISWTYSGNGSGHAQVSYSGTQNTPGGNKVYIYQTLSSDAGAIYVNVNGLNGRTTTAANINVALELADYLLF